MLKTILLSLLRTAKVLAIVNIMPEFSTLQKAMRSYDAMQ